MATRTVTTAAQDQPAGKPPPDAGAFPARRVLVAACGSADVLTLPQSIMVMRHALGLDVRVVLTPAAARFVPARSFTLLTGHPALVDEDATTEVPHLALTAWADLVLVMPATANTLAKAALGIADNLVGTCLLAAAAPVVLVPSMNAAMWQRSAVQRNVARLRDDGYVVVPPVPVLALSTGTLAGRGMPPVEVVLERAAEHLRRAGGSRG
ncbi:flavoprotein [Micromonospora soli]|uniref:flavoprotein n=1 Tax=Micromonospora sp. NBRC 110009 TaxID=3061627 RepID=UPI0026715E3E|nr:flavoprotein [Micromonospora sp. NBRC 110009]WKT97746.1 flavoprotein [Micromonospora sp. NBRC 110009]